MTASERDIWPRRRVAARACLSVFGGWAAMTVLAACMGGFRHSFVAMAVAYLVGITLASMVVIPLRESRLRERYASNAQLSAYTRARLTGKFDPDLRPTLGVITRDVAQTTWGLVALAVAVCVLVPVSGLMVMTQHSSARLVTVAAAFLLFVGLFGWWDRRNLIRLRDAMQSPPSG